METGREILDMGNYELCRINHIAMTRKDTIFVSYWSEFWEECMLQVLDFGGQRLRRWKPDMMSQIAVAVSGDEVFLANWFWVKVFRSDGCFLRQWRLMGDVHGRSLLVVTEARVFIAMCSQIQVFSCGGRFLHQWNIAGHRSNTVSDLALFGDLLYVSVYGFEPQVQVFQLDGTFLRGWSPWEGGEFMTPSAIAVSQDGEVFVNDRERLLVFALDGSFIKQLDRPRMEEATGLAIAENGEIIVSDSTCLYLL